MYSNIDEEVKEILASAKILAKRYYNITGKPLGVTGEIAEYEAARLLRLELTPARQAGYDAIEIRDGAEFKLQIKGRRIDAQVKPSARISRIDVAKAFDGVLLVLLDADFEATHIYEATREHVISALVKPGSKSRNERGALSVGKFKSLAQCRWSREA